MRLVEILDTLETLPYERQGNVVWIDLPEGQEVVVQLGPNVGFFVQGKRGGGKELSQQDLTAMFNTIAHVVSEWIRTDKPNRFVMLADDSTRRKIYQVLINRIAPVHPEYDIEANVPFKVGSSVLRGWQVTRK